MSETEPKRWPFTCPHCKRVSNGAVRGKAYRLVDSEIPQEFSFVQCERCQDVTVQLREDAGTPGGFSDDERPLTVFPAGRALSQVVPPPLAREWSEAWRCMEIEAYSGAANSVRRLLEGACIQHGISEPNLHGSLDRLRDAGHINEMLWSWADALRVFGNEGSHFNERALSREDAEDALAFAEALLDHLYVLRFRFDAFKARIEQRRSDR